MSYAIRFWSHDSVGGWVLRDDQSRMTFPTELKAAEWVRQHKAAHVWMKQRGISPDATPAEERADNLWDKYHQACTPDRCMLSGVSVCYLEDL